MVQLVIVLSVSMGLMVVDTRYQYLDNVRSFFTTLVAPVMYTANIPSEISSWTDNNIVSRRQLILQNQELKDELLILKAQNQRLVGLESDNARLRSLLGSSRKLRGKRLIAEIINVHSTQFSQEAVINKGSSDDLYLGQSVVDSEGVMGQLVDVASFSSRLILITDSNHSIPVKNNRNGIRAIAQGNGINLNILYLANTIDIQPGDLLLSSGLGEKFPDGYPVAKVISVVRKTDQPYAEVIAEPTANINTADHVLLLWNVKPEQSVEDNRSEGSQPVETSESPESGVEFNG